MEFYHLDYTLAIFGPETNLKGKTQDKEGLATRAGVKQAQKDKPILQQLIEMIQNGNFSSSTKPATSEPKYNDKIEPLAVPSMPKAATKDTKQKEMTNLHLNKAQNLLEELQREEKSGF